VNSIALHSLKGGVGKTSLAVHLGAALATDRRRVVLLDADPQESALSWAEWSADQQRPLPYDVHRIDATHTAAAFQRQFERLTEGADLAVVDLPPELAESARFAALTVDLLLVPCTPSALDLRSAHAAVDLARKAREIRRGKLPLVSLVPSMVTARTRIGAELPEALADYGEPVSPPVRRSVTVAQAGADGGTTRPSAPVTQDFAAVARHVLARLRAI